MKRKIYTFVVIMVLDITKLLSVSSYIKHIKKTKKQSISRQGVYEWVAKGVVNSVSIDGRLFILID